MISTFTALLDANILFGPRLRSLILYQAQLGLFACGGPQKFTRSG